MKRRICGRRFEHGELLGPGVAARLLGAAQALQQRHHAAFGRIHAEAADAGQLDDVAGRHGADHRIAGFAPRLQGGQDHLDMVVHEQHVGDDDVGAFDVGARGHQLGLVLAPFGGGVQAQHQARQFAAQRFGGAIDGARQMPVQRHDDDADRDRLSGRNGLWHRKASPP